VCLYNQKALRKFFFLSVGYQGKSSTSREKLHFVATLAKGFISGKSLLQETIPDIDCIIHKLCFVEKQSRMLNSVP